MKLRSLLLFLLVCWSTAPAQQGADKFVRAANLIVDAMMSDNYEPLVKEYTRENLEALPLFKTQIFFRNMLSQYGKVRRIDPPHVVNSSHAVILFYFDRGVQDLKLYLDPADKIDGFIFVANTDVQRPDAAATTAPAPAPAAPVVPDKQKTDLSLPFTGTWIVSAGGEPKEGAAARNLFTQQWAYEFTAIVNGSARKTDGKTNEDYHGFGKEVLAPADGVVSDVIDGVRDNILGESVNSYVPIGNTIMIRHRDGEYSVLSYLKQGSIRVKAGDKVTRGQVIAQVGNSGRSLEPTLHFHLQDTPVFQAAKGVKFYFEKTQVTRDGAAEAKLVYSPVAGDILAP